MTMLKQLNTKYDSAARRASKRNPRERGCWIYVPAEELAKTGYDPYSETPPRYRVWGRARGSILVRFYREK